LIGGKRQKMNKSQHTTHNIANKGLASLGSLRSVQWYTKVC